MAQAGHDLQPGDHVSWSFGVGQARGQVVKKLTENKKIGSRVFKASPEDPKYLVKTETSGKEAIKKPEALHKIVDLEDKGGVNKDSTNNDIHGQKQQYGGVKEKREGFKERATEAEKKEAEGDEEAKKVADVGKGSVRESVGASYRQAHGGHGGDEAGVVQEEKAALAGKEEEDTADNPQDEEGKEDDEDAIDQGGGGGGGDGGGEAPAQEGGISSDPPTINK